MFVLLAATAIAQMSCLDQTCAALRDDGKVLIWGRYNPVKELKSDTPREIPGLSGVKQVAVGGDFFLALKQDGTVWSWGVDRNGILGNHTAPDQQLKDSEVPVRVTGLTGVASVIAGSKSAFALKADGTVWAWGEHRKGLLGIGLIPSATPASRPESASQLFPVQVRGIKGVRQISAGMYHTLALLEDGRVMAWGYNGEGALGDGTTEDRWEPVAVSGLSGVVKVAAGSNCSLAVLKDGTVRVWGSNYTGLLLDGTRQGFSQAPKPVAGIRTATDGAAGIGHFLVLLANGTVQGWGVDGWGQCGDGKTGNYALSIVTTKNLIEAVSISASANGGFAKLKDGRLMGWGAIYVEPMQQGKYWTALPVEWSPEGWFRPGGYGPKPQ